MNYAEKSDAEINVEVAKLIFPASEMNTPYYHRPDVYIYHRNGTSEHKDYCNSWADAGPIIERHEINILFNWNEEGIHGAVPSFPHRDCEDKNPLRAAMTAFLMMQGAR